GWKRIDSLLTMAARVIGSDGKPHWVTSSFKTGHKKVFRLCTMAGFELRATVDHKVLTASGDDVPVEQLKSGDRVRLMGAGFGVRKLSEGVATALGVLATVAESEPAAVGDGVRASRPGGRDLS